MNEALHQYCLQLADSGLILGHRISEWCGHGPALEEDIALTNTALDLIGQSRLFYQYAAEVEGKGRTEDDLAYFRDVWDFRNVQLVEQPNGDYAMTIARQLIYSAFTFHFYVAMADSTDERLREIAAKAVKEVNYHLRHASQWVVRLGDGTEESQRRMQAALDALWKYSGALFVPSEAEAALLESGVSVDLAAIKTKWDATMDAVLSEAKLQRPEEGWMAKGGKKGVHTEHLGFILAEMQYLQRAYPGNDW